MTATDTAPVPPEVERVLRTSQPHWVVTRATTRTVLHVPDPKDQDRPACDSTSRKHGWVTKPIAVFPEGFYPVCEQCVRAMFAPPGTFTKAD